jgi:hypothetical protein
MGPELALKGFDLLMALAECVDRSRRRGRRATRDDPNPGDPSLRLRLDGERCAEEAASQGADERPSGHHRISSPAA